MTTIACDDGKRAKRQYDIDRRPLYKERKAELRKGWKETEKNNTKKWKSQRENWPSVLFTNARYRAKKRGIEFSLNMEDVVIPEFCPVLGIKLEMGTGNSYIARDCAPSLDRIENHIGYVKGNVRIISWRANRIKTDATISELRAVLLYMEGGAPSQP